MKLPIASLLVSATVIATGCSHPAPPPPAPPAAAGIRCGNVAEHLVQLMASEKQDVPRDAIDKLTGVVEQSCEATSWTEAAKACAMAATSHDDIHVKCGAQLTDAQGADLNQRLNTAFPGRGTGSAATPPPPANNGIPQSF